MEAVQGYTRKSLVDGLQRKVEKGVQISSERVKSGKKIEKKRKNSQVNLRLQAELQQEVIQELKL